MSCFDVSFYKCLTHFINELFQHLSKHSSPLYVVVPYILSIHLFFHHPGLSQTLTLSNACWYPLFMVICRTMRCRGEGGRVVPPFSVFHFIHLLVKRRERRCIEQIVVTCTASRRSYFRYKRGIFCFHARKLLHPSLDWALCIVISVLNINALLLQLP